jgi:uncharacterized protein YjiS (DUF1127 family)
MSRNQPAPERMRVPDWPALPRAARYLAAVAANWIAPVVVRRVERRAHRELAALDDRTLADMGLGRAELTSLLEALAETRAALSLSQLPWTCPRPGA